MQRKTLFLITVLCVILLFIAAFTLKKSLPDGSDKEHRLSYLSSLGWSCKELDNKTREITIPSQFNEIYQNYAQMLKESGYDIYAYRGEKATVYRYELLNFKGDSGYQKDVGITLIVSNGKIIAGDISSNLLDGFMKALHSNT